MPSGSGARLGAAVELADLEFPPDDVDRILAAGIYHRHVLFSPARAQTLRGVRARVERDGREVAVAADATALTGSLSDVLAAVRLAAGRELRGGEVVIAGSVVPPQPVAPGERWRVDLGPLGSLSVAFS